MPSDANGSAPPESPSPPNEDDIREVGPQPFKGASPQRIHDADAQLLIAIVVSFAFLVIVGLEAYGCFGRSLCASIHDVKDTFEAPAFAVLIAFGTVAGFYFADRRH